MPHLKCVRCRIRVYGEQSQPGGASEPCPECGWPLEGVDRLSELVGLQERRRDGVSDISRWLGDADSVMPQAVAKALAVPPTS